MRRLKKELNSIDWRAGAYATKFLTRTVCQWFLVSLRVSDWLFFILSSLYKPRDKGISLMLIYSNFMKSNRGILIFSLSKILLPLNQSDTKLNHITRWRLAFPALEACLVYFTTFSLAPCVIYLRFDWLLW